MLNWRKTPYGGSRDKKILSPDAKRRAAQVLIDTMGFSVRAACRVVELARSTFLRTPLKGTPADPNAWLRAWLREFAVAYPRWGFRRAHAALRMEGHVVNRKQVLRLWRKEGLRVPQRRHRRTRAGKPTTEPIKADHPNAVWSINF